MSAILPKLEPADVTVKREMDDILEDNELTSQSPAAKRVKAGRKPPHAPEDGEQTSHTTPADSPKGRKTTGTAQTPSPSKATTTNGAPGGLIPEDKAAMTEELIAAGLSAIGVRNIAAKCNVTDRQVYNHFQGGKPGNLRGKLVNFARTYKQ